MAGIDLHSNNALCGLMDESGRRLVHKKLPCELPAILQLLEPYKERIATGLSDELIHGLPVGQDYRDLQKLIPGVQYTSRVNKLALVNFVKGLVSFRSQSVWPPTPSRAVAPTRHF